MPELPARHTPTRGFGAVAVGCVFQRVQQQVVELLRESIAAHGIALDVDAALAAVEDRNNQTSALPGAIVAPYGAIRVPGLSDASSVLGDPAPGIRGDEEAGGIEAPRSILLNGLDGRRGHGRRQGKGEANA